MDENRLGRIFASLTTMATLLALAASLLVAPARHGYAASAMAFDPKTGAYAYRYNLRTEEEAQDRALRSCFKRVRNLVRNLGSDSYILTIFRQGC